MRRGGNGAEGVRRLRGGQARAAHTSSEKMKPPYMKPVACSSRKDEKRTPVATPSLAEDLILTLLAAASEEAYRSPNVFSRPREATVRIAKRLRGGWRSKGVRG